MEPIAIVGLSCRFPSAPTPAAFWELLCGGVDAIREVPPERWNAADFYAPDVAADGKMNSRWGGFLEDVDRFDPHPFRIAPREAARMDPQQRLLLELAWEALDDAGQVRPHLAGSATGVFIGIGGNDYGRMVLSDARLIDSYTNTGNAWCIAANRLSYVFDLRGPSIAIDSACSSSLIAVHLACQSLLQGESTLALAGGVNLILAPEPTIGFSKLSALSPDGRCKPFSATANGYVRGEGAGLVVLKPLARALAEHDPIYAVIRGSAVNQDGRTNGLTAPNRFSQEQVLRQAYQNAGVGPGTVQYVEAHGTGTLLGDPIEAQALGSVLATGRAPDAPCLIGSVKSNIGHLEPAAGIAGLIKTVLMLHHALVPPSLHAEELNPHIPFARLPLRVVRQLEPWPAGGDTRLAGVSAFSFGGTNAHVVLESAPHPAPTHAHREPAETAAHLAQASLQSVGAGRADAADQGPYLLPVSGHTPAALAARARDLAQVLREEPAVSLDDVGSTLARRRTHLDQRAAVVGEGREQVIARLEQLACDPASCADGVCAEPHGTSSLRQLALVLSGEPGPWLLGARDLYAQEPVFRAALDACESEVAQQTGASLLGHLHNMDSSGEVPDVVLFGVHVALCALWRGWGVAFEAIVGHGAGHVAAAHVMGRLSLEDAVRLLGQPPQAVAGNDVPATDAVSGDGPPTTGAVTSDGPPATRATSGHGLPAARTVSGDNVPTTGAVSGDDVPATGAAAGDDSPAIRTAAGDDLPTTGAVSGRRSPAARTTLGHGLPSTPTGAGDNPPGLIEAGSDLPALIEAGFDVFLEVGPPSAAAATLIRGARVAALAPGRPARAGLLEALGRLFSLGVDVDWSALYPAPGRCVPLPAYPWQRERLWVDAPPVARVLTPSASPGHPLLGRRLRSALADIQFELDVSVDTPRFLGDHRISGAHGPLAVMPGAGYIAMVLSAAKLALGMPRCVLEDVLFLHPLALADGERRTVQLIIGATPAERRPFRIASIGAEATDNGEQTWTVHTTGYLGPLATAASVDLAPARARCRQPQAGADLYAALADAGYHLGPSFRWFETVWRGEGEAVGALRPATASSSSDVDGVDLHPGLVDASLQLVGYTLLTSLAGGTTADETFVPMSVQRVTFGGLPDGQLRCHVTSDTPASSQRDVLGGDARLVDGRGRLVLGLERLRGKRVRRTDLFERRPRVMDHNDELLYAVRWAATPRPVDGSAPAAQRFLILADRGGTGAALATALAQRGQSCGLVAAGSAFEPTGPASWRVDPGAPADFERVLRDGAGWDGIVSLWGLDDTLDEREPSAASLAGALGGAVHLVQALASMAQAQPPRLWLVTRGVQAVGAADEATAPGQAPLWGLAAVIAHEHPRLACTAIDLDPAAPMALEPLVAELLDADHEDRLALRAGHRYAARLHHAADAAQPSDRLSAAMTAQPLDRRHAVADADDDGSRSLDRLRADATYLITGGLGALGLRVAHWMVDRGARHLVLVGRRGAHGDAAFHGVDALERRGAQVLVGRADVADADALARLLDEVHGSLPPLRGVVHAAGTLDDGLLLGQSWPRFERALRAKVDGAWNLHRLTQRCELDFFVLFSSIASLLGSPGQSSYAAANAFQDALAGYRRGRGLPALSVNWGPWERLGMAAGLGAPRGLQALSADQALAALSALLSTERAQVGVLAADWPRLVEQRGAGGVPPLLATLVQAPKAARAPWLREQLREVPAHDWHDWLTAHVQAQVAELLERADRAAVDVQRGLFDLGMDSLVAMELKNRLEAALGEALPPTLAFEYPTIDALAGYLADRLRSTPDATPVAAPAPVVAAPRVALPIEPEPMADADVGLLLDQLSDLSDADALRLLLGER